MKRTHDSDEGNLVSASPVTSPFVTSPFPQPSPFQFLSSDIGIQIALLLELDDICAMSLTCKSWAKFSSEEVLWRSLVERDFHRGKS
jgi:hypothetical protein